MGLTKVSKSAPNFRSSPTCPTSMDPVAEFPWQTAKFAYMFQYCGPKETSQRSPFLKNRQRASTVAASWRPAFVLLLPVRRRAGTLTLTGWLGAPLPLSLSFNSLVPVSRH
jgi:hypothetical protein